MCNGAFCISCMKLYASSTDLMLSALIYRAANLKIEPGNSWRESARGAITWDRLLFCITCDKSLVHELAGIQEGQKPSGIDIGLKLLRQKEKEIEVLMSDFFLIGEEQDKKVTP